jgi:hypothetical protein
MSFVKFADHPIINDGITGVHCIGQLQCDFEGIDPDQFPNIYLRVQIIFGNHDDDLTVKVWYQEREIGQGCFGLGIRQLQYMSY